VKAPPTTLQAPCLLGARVASKSINQKPPKHENNRGKGERKDKRGAEASHSLLLQSLGIESTEIEKLFYRAF